MNDVGTESISRCLYISEIKVRRESKTLHRRLKCIFLREIAKKLRSPCLDTVWDVSMDSRRNHLL